MLALIVFTFKGGSILSLRRPDFKRIIPKFQKKTIFIRKKSVHLKIIEC